MNKDAPKYRICKTISEAYLTALSDVWNHYEYKASPRGQDTREITDYTFTVLHPTIDPIKTFDKERNKVIADYSKKEFDIYNSGTNSVDDFAKISKFWKKLANPDGTINSAYGHLIWFNKSHGDPIFENNDQIKQTYEDERNGILDFTDGFYQRRKLASDPRRTPWDWAKESLIRDKDTRQSILRFSLPEHQWFGNKDQVCTLHGNFLIREDKLNLSITMRSNDLMLGLVYDLPWFCSLIHKMVDELKPHYPELKVGTYTHTAHSIHIYEKNKDAILSMLRRK